MVYGAPTTHFGDDGLADMTDPGVIAHEEGHSMNSFEYQGDSGAWEESKADISSLIVLHKMMGITKPAEAPEEVWLLGDSLVKDIPGPNGTVIKQSLRRADKPGFASRFDIQELANGKNGKPHISAVRANANDRNVQGDNGGVHIFSSLSTYVFYLTTIAINEPLYERPAKLWYAVCSNQSIRRNANWQELADATVAQARTMGYHDIADQLVKNWGVVGIQARDSRHFAPQYAVVQPVHPAYAPVSHYGVPYYGAPIHLVHAIPTYHVPRFWMRA
jgi:Zn-dependent metalloprotease